MMPLLSLSLSLSLSLLLLLLLLLLSLLLPALHCDSSIVAWERKQGARAGTARRCKRPHTGKRIVGLVVGRGMRV